MGGKPKKLALKIRSELLLSKFWSAHSRSTSDTRERRYIYIPHTEELHFPSLFTNPVFMGLLLLTFDC